MNGYMKAYHCILDYALQNLSGSCFVIFYYIYRKTIGWNKFQDNIPLTSFIKETGLKRNCVIDSISKLEKERWIHVSREVTAGDRSPKKKGRPYNLYSVGELVWNPNQLEKPTSCKDKPTTGLKNQPKEPTTGLKNKLSKDKDLKDTKKETPPQDTGDLDKEEPAQVDRSQKEEEVFQKVLELWPKYKLSHKSTKWKSVQKIAEYDDWSINEAFEKAKGENVGRGKFIWILNRLENPTAYGVKKPKTKAEIELDKAIKKLKELRDVTPGGDNEVPGVVNFISRATGKTPETILSEYKFPRSWKELGGE